MRMEGSSMQTMLLNLLKQPDPKSMLKSSRPFDRSQETLSVSSSGHVVKHYWQGALPAKVRDESLNLAYDVQMSKMKSSMPTGMHQIRSHSIGGDHSLRKPKGTRSMHSSFYDAPFEHNYSAYAAAAVQPLNSAAASSVGTPQMNNNTSLELTSQSFTSSPKQQQQQVQQSRWKSQEFRNIVGQNRERTETSERVSTSPQARTEKYFGGTNLLLEADEPEKRKSFSIKYIGVHKDVIGVLSRKIPLEYLQDKKANRKHLFLQPLKDEKDLAGMNSPFRQRTQVSFFQHPKKDEGMSRTSQTQQSSPLSLRNVISHENPEHALRLISEEEFGQHPPNSIYGEQNSNQSQQQQQNIEKLRTPKKMGSFNLRQTTYQRFYGEPIQKSNQKIDDLSSEMVPSSVQQSRPQTCVDKSQFPSMIQYNGAKRHELSSTAPQSSTGLRNGSGQQQQQQQQNLDQDQMEQQENGEAPYEVPNPAKYDKYLVHKYSIQRRLTALRKPKEESPCFQKKQLFTFLNNF